MRENFPKIFLKNHLIKIKVLLDQRKKGNLWFPTYKTYFEGVYSFKLKNNKSGISYLYTTLESVNSIYKDIKISINSKQIKNILPLINKKEIPVFSYKNNIITLKISYSCTGMEQLNYLITPKYNDIAQINNFTLTLITDFDNFDFPKDMMSPSKKIKTKTGYELIWKLNNSVTGKDIGLIIPNKLNPGEIVSRVSFFAPISLLFFFLVIIVLALLNNINIHPVNYFFIAATFFSFHLMFSYFSDSINIYLSFIIASTISILLTTTYLRFFTSKIFAYVYAPIAQLIYLIVFSFSFFFKGITGLIVTISSVITLFVLMQITGKLNWDEIFKQNK